MTTTTQWTSNKLRIAIPEEYRDLGNKAASLFDPNVAGELTFPIANAYIRLNSESAEENFDPELENVIAQPDIDVTATHCLASSLFVIDFVPMLIYRDPNIWEGVLSQMSEQRGKETLSREEIETLCNVLLFDEECINLVKI